MGLMKLLSMTRRRPGMLLERRCDAWGEKTTNDVPGQLVLMPPQERLDRQPSRERQLAYSGAVITAPSGQTG